jgi:hypothetical protein
LAESEDQFSIVAEGDVHNRLLALFEDDLTAQSQSRYLEVKDGDRAAFTGLFETYYAPMCAYAFRFVDDHELTKDVVQEVFVWIWQQRNRWKPGVSVRC